MTTELRANFEPIVQALSVAGTASYFLGSQGIVPTITFLASTALLSMTVMKHIEPLYAKGAVALVRQLYPQQKKETENKQSVKHLKIEDSAEVKYFKDAETDQMVGRIANVITSVTFAVFANSSLLSTTHAAINFIAKESSIAGFGSLFLATAFTGAKIVLISVAALAVSQLSLHLFCIAKKSDLDVVKNRFESIAKVVSVAGTACYLLGSAGITPTIAFLASTVLLSATVMKRAEPLCMRAANWFKDDVLTWNYRDSVDVEMTGRLSNVILSVVTSIFAKDLLLSTATAAIDFFAKDASTHLNIGLGKLFLETAFTGAKVFAASNAVLAVAGLGFYILVKTAPTQQE